MKDVEGSQFLPKDEKERLTKEKMDEFWTRNPPVFVEANDDIAMDEAALAISIKTKESLNIDVKDPN